MALPFGRVLQLGSKGPDVVAVKLALHAWKPAVMTNRTDFFGKGTESAVKKLQTKFALAADGVYGPKTHAELAPFFNAEAAKLYAKASVPTLVQPIPKPYFTHKGGIHETAGLPGYPAYDFFAKAGSPVIAPEQGMVWKFSGHDPAHGPVSGIHGPFGWSIYLKGKSGTDYYLTHLGSRFCGLDQLVRCGEKIATVADYARWGGADHTHVGVHGGRVSITELGNAPLASG